MGCCTDFFESLWEIFSSWGRLFKLVVLLLYTLLVTILKVIRRPDEYAANLIEKAWTARSDQERLVLFAAYFTAVNFLFN
jgi:hypothetical protein